MKTDYRPTALERRHPGIVARKRREAEARLRDERYRNAQCTECGYPLGDFDLANGFDRCGDCETS